MNKHVQRRYNGNSNRLPQTFKSLKKQYEKVCNEIVKMFCEKQDVDFDFWIGDQVGECASFINEYSFTMAEIILDLESKQPIGFIFEWQRADIDFNMFRKEPFHVNYASYIKGLRFKEIDNE
jgi:hypothetical protein